MSQFIAIREYARRRGCSDTLVRKAIKAGKIEESALKRDKTGKIEGIRPDLADKQWESNFNTNRSKNDALHQQFTRPEPDDEPELERSEPERGQKGTASIASAQKVEAVYKAKLRELEYKRKAGELIPKDATYRALYALGQEIRSSLQAIPDRVIDELLAAPSRNDAHTILTRELHEVLTRLANIENAKPLDTL